MKTTVSIPNDLYEEAERVARREGRSRSQVYSAALREYVARHDPDAIVAAIDHVVAKVEEGMDPVVVAASRQKLEATAW